MRDLTVLILTFNERENIGRCLKQLGGLGPIVIVDSFSTDGTSEIAKTFSGVEIVERRFDTHTQQWNFGLDQVRTPWVLTLDADYLVTPELASELDRLEPADEVSGYSAAFYYSVFGRRLRANAYPPRTVLFRKVRGRYVDDGHTQRLQIDGPVLPLRGRIEHDDRKPLSRWLQSQDRYMTLEARHLLSTSGDQLNRQDWLRKQIYFAPFAMSFYLMIGRGLILDGWPGWYYVGQRTIAEMLLSLRLVTERERLEEKDKIPGQ